MSFLSLHYLPRDTKDDSEWGKYSERMRPLRLRSLKEDSRSFVSKYEVEINEPPAFWIGRLKDPKAWSIVMVQSSEQVAEEKNILLREDAKWVAFCVMIDPRASEEGNQAAKPLDEQSEELPDWYMAALWLDPDLRGQGAGRRLVQYGLDVARQADSRDRVNGRSCATQVVKGNTRALELYQQVGFKVTNPDSMLEKDGVIHYATEMKIVL